MSNLTVYNKSMEISKDGQVFPYSSNVPGGYKINLGHPYAGMGIELELNKVIGWSCVCFSLLLCLSVDKNSLR